MVGGGGKPPSPGEIMYQKKPGAFRADWWDADGRRHRKQFATSAAAKEHEHRETALAHAERASREMKLAASSGKRPRAKAENGTIEPAKGKLGIMIPGMGAVATTFVAGVEAIRKGLAKPIGSLDRKSTRLNSSHQIISYAVFCLKKKNSNNNATDT